MTHILKEATAGTIFGIAVGLVMAGLLVYRSLTCPYYLVKAESIKIIYEPKEVADEELYKQQCESEIKAHLEFPLGKVDKIIVTNGFFSIDHTVEKKNIPLVLKLLNDTASYVWGEVGTFIPGKKIIFYDSRNNPVGITHIDKEEVFTYSHPYLCRMKWGTLTEKGNKELHRLIEE